MQHKRQLIMPLQMALILVMFREMGQGEVLQNPMLKNILKR